ncbi:MAG: hypothetical protein K2N18_05025, partial [Clostridia bacterium]|nr:hypothetical protein [Clostridia bacterium]
MKKDKNIKNEPVAIVNKDADGKVIGAAFPVSKRTKKDQSKTSVIYTLLAVLLHVLAFVPVVAVPIVLAVKCYQLAPYYSFWHFIGVIISAVFAIIYTVVVFCVTRKKSKSNIAMQTVKIAITFTCLTSVFALIMTYALPDVIEMATQNTLFVEDGFYNSEAQAEKNLKLDRDFIMYNLLNGNLNDHSKSTGDYSYATLSKRTETSSGMLQDYLNKDINDSYKQYKAYSNMSSLQAKVIDKMKDEQPRKYELYNFVYNTYVLNDFDYALYNSIDRRAFALAIVDYEYEHAHYDKLIKEGFNNKKIKQIFETNFNNFNHDGYQTFDDPLLLYAQLDGRLTTSVIVHILLNDGWSYSQGSYDDKGNVQFIDEGNLLFEQYNPDARDKYIAEKDKKGEAKFEFEGTLLNADGKEYKAKYGFNSDGWMVFENGVVKRPVQWSVLDMDGNKMDLASIDLFGMLPEITIDQEKGTKLNLSSFIAGALPMFGKLFDAAGELLKEDLQELIGFVTGGASINISLCINDDNMLDIGLLPSNSYYGLPGYAQSSWVQSNNLLMAVINLLGIRNWLSIFGAVGIVLVIAAGILRECAKRTRLRTAVARDRIIREKTAKSIADGTYTPNEVDEHSVLASELTLADILKIANAQQGKDVLGGNGKKLEDIDLDNLDDIDLSSLDLSGLDLSDIDLGDLDLDGIDLSDLDLSDIDLAGLDLDSLGLSEDKPNKKNNDKKKEKKAVEKEEAPLTAATETVNAEEPAKNDAPETVEAAETAPAAAEPLAEQANAEEPTEASEKAA